MIHLESLNRSKSRVLKHGFEGFRVLEGFGLFSFWNLESRVWSLKVSRV